MITAQSGYLQNLNIKNGRQLDSIYLFCSTAPTTPLNVCADDFEIDSVSHMIARHHNLMFPRQVFINSYCSFFPGGNYNTITGKLRLDLNNNGCDNADAGMPNVPIKISEAAGQYYIPSADANGDYKSYTNKGIFLIQPYFPFAYYFVNPVNTSVTFDTANNLINTSNFCIKPNGTHNDLEVIVLPLGAARPGFNTSYKLVYKNKGTTTLSGNVQLNFDNSKMNFITASTVVSSQTTGQLNWNYVNLAPFENRTINITFDLPAQPVNNMGDTLIFLAQINPVANDETAYDNSFVLPQLVRASFDPNDKECLEGSQIDISSINNYLHYLIRFQNVGNDTAFNVVIVDTLSNNLDWNTVEFIDGSHPCHISQKNNKLEFFFADIQLPYKAINEPASNGYIAFRIKPKNTLSIGDSLNNKAAIYFDFNFPVITNTATTILRSLPIIPVRLEYFSGSKQRSKNLLTWKASATNGFTNFSIERSNDGIHFISIGNITASADRCQSPFDLADNNPLAGKNFYRLKITDIDRVVFYSKIVLLENNNRYLEILSITGNNSSNAVYLNSAKQQSVQLKVVATDGRTIYLNNKIISADNSKIELPLNKIAKGIYTLIIYTSEGEMITKRFVK